MDNRPRRWEAMLLAAGAGSRMGMPKALMRDPGDEPWLVRSVRALREGGCEQVTVVLGAAAEEAEPLVAGLGVRVLRAVDWEDGMAASLRAGLAMLAGEPEPGPGVLVHLVDLPDIGPRVIRRLLSHAGGPETLARAVYDGSPGHPVLIGGAHWPALLDQATGLSGDSGARRYLLRHAAVEVECGDLASGRDVDSATDLTRSRSGEPETH